MDPARLIAAARFFGSGSAGLCTGDSRPLLAATRVAEEAARLVEFCRFVAMMNSSYRDLCRIINRCLGLGVRLRPARPVEHADEPRPGSPAALFAHDLRVDAQGELGVGVAHLVHDVDGVLAA